MQDILFRMSKIDGILAEAGAERPTADTIERPDGGLGEILPHLANIDNTLAAIDGVKAVTDATGKVHDAIDELREVLKRKESWYA
jgi:hypothetical protein